jgi:hypothetical protein
MPVTDDSDGTTWIVTLDSNAAVEPIRRAIERAGLTIQQFLESVSIMIAIGTAVQAEKARQIEGVLAIEANPHFEIASLDAPVS